MHKSFYDTHQIHQACLSYGHTTPKKTALPGGTHQTYKRQSISAKIYTDTLGPATCFELNCGPTYMFTKKTSIPTFSFRSKTADELARELWPVSLYKKPSVWSCWLRIAHIFPPNFVRLQAEICHQLNSSITPVAPGNQIYLHLRLICYY